MDNKVRRIVIAGGGTAGWIAAAALSRLLGPLLDITLIESDDIGTVGVGEATIPTHRTFHHLIGIDERKFMKATQATFKLGISFENWGQIGDRYIHSFGQIGRPNWMGDFHHIWMAGQEQGIGGSLDDYCLELKAADAEKFATDEKSRISYAYHLDASRYARFLRSFAEPLGVVRKEGKIIAVNLDGESGFISSLTMDNGDVVEGDLFIDCTGFRGVLIEGALRTGYDDWTEWLFTDSALAVQTRSTGPAIPYTRSIAHDAGWRWRIPLQQRVGNGLVYSKEFLGDDEARGRLLELIEGEMLTEPRLIRYQTGRRKMTWNRNCIALGLASGFLEPLESTSIHLIQNTIFRLIKLFPFSGIEDAIVQRFNDQCTVEVERIRDFIILHYKATKRNDSPFWDRCREMAVPDTLTHRMEMFRRHALAWQDGQELFRVDSWVQVMMGQGLIPEGHHALGKLMNPDQLRRALDGIRGNITRTVAALPSHQAFVDQYCPAMES